MDSIFNYEHPFVTTDAVIFSAGTADAPKNHRKLPETNLRVLLYNRPVEPYTGKWCLPGGFLDIDELPEDNVRRKLFDKVQISDVWLEQLYTFGKLDRDPRARVISMAYLGLMNEKDADKVNGGSEWFIIDKARLNEGEYVFCNPAVAPDTILDAQDFGFDHYNIIKTALQRLRSKILYTDIAFNLLPVEFTLIQLQNVYEAVLGFEYQAANFRQKIAHMVAETGKYTSGMGHRPAKIFTKKDAK